MPGGLLAPVLEGVEREEREPCRILARGMDADDATLLVEIITNGKHGYHRPESAYAGVDRSL